MTDHPARRNIKLVVAYNGSAYHGWQRQVQGLATVQQCVEEAASEVVRHRVIVFVTGRTDAGVHAAGQVANFYTTNLAIPTMGLRRAMNSRLPGDIAIISAEDVPEDFHASRSATGKTYRYRIHVGPLRPVMHHEQVYHYYRTLEVAKMRDAACRLIGTHDFRGFATTSDKRKTTVRTIFRCDVTEVGEEIRVTVHGDGFLYNMVRNIVGTLIEIGRGRWPADRIDRILATCDRSEAGFTAPAQGLSLLSVHFEK